MAENQACQHGWEFLAGQYDHSLFAASSGNHGKVINIILIALVVQFIKRRFEGDYEKGDAK